MRRRAVAALAPAALALALPAGAQPTRDYHVLVGSEAVDQVALVRFGPAGIAVERRHEVGVMLADPDGPHGVAASPVMCSTVEAS